MLSPLPSTHLALLLTPPPLPPPRRRAAQVFLGGDTVARNLKQLQDNGITHVLNAAGVACPNYHEASKSFEYLTLHLHDSADEDISTIMYDAVAFVEKVVVSGGKVPASPPPLLHTASPHSPSRLTSPACLL